MVLHINVLYELFGHCTLVTEDIFANLSLLQVCTFQPFRRSLHLEMSHRGPLTAVITTVLGATLGGLLIWRVYRTKRKRLPSIQKAADPVEAPCPVGNELKPAEHRYTQQQPSPTLTPSSSSPLLLEKEFKAAQCQTTQLPPPVQIPTYEQLLGVKPVMVSSEEEWEQLWPLMQKELSVFPVLGLDCEWVKAKGVRNTFACFSIQRGKIHPELELFRSFFLIFRSDQWNNNI